MAGDEQDDPSASMPAKSLSLIRRRIIKSAVEIEADDPEAIVYQHSVLAQICLPYRDPGDAERRWKRSQGAAHLEIEAGRAFDPAVGDFVDVGLPHGPKPRLILAHLNASALRTSSPEIEVEHSLSAFAGRIGLCRDGRSIRTLREQLTRLTTATIRLALAVPGAPARQVQGSLLADELELWPPAPGHRVPWASSVTLSAKYFDSLTRHAVPLDERAVAALSHSAMGLDIYCWLAQRLHRIDPGKPAFITWTALQEQFGWHYAATFKFRQVFRQTLDLVHGVYRGARIELDSRGMTLRHSPPPVRARLAVAKPRA